MNEYGRERVHWKPRGSLRSFFFFLFFLFFSFYFPLQYFCFLTWKKKKAILQLGRSLRAKYREPINSCCPPSRSASWPNLKNRKCHKLFLRIVCRKLKYQRKGKSEEEEGQGTKRGVERILEHDVGHAATKDKAGETVGGTCRPLSSSTDNATTGTPTPPYCKPTSSW